MNLRSKLEGGSQGTPVSSAVDQLVDHCVRAVAPSGDVVVLHVPSGVYLRFDSTASTIVDLLVDTRDADLAAAALSSRYSIPAERATTDVESVLSAISSLKASRSSTPRRPSLSGSMETIRSWWGLPPTLKIPVVQATAVVIVVEAGIRFTDVARLAGLMRVPLSAEPPVRSDVSVAEPTAGGRVDDAKPVTTLTTREQRNYVATMWVLDRWLYDGTCLRRALVSGYFLRRHHPSLRLGLIDDGETSHAWIEAEGQSFNAVPVSGTFTGTWGPDRESA
jgi:hypothetical protein